MAYVAVDKNKEEWIYNGKPRRGDTTFGSPYGSLPLPKGTIKKLIGKKLNWKDEPVKLKDKK